jgi:dipeptidyl aminopeptidase/acylaminoacyl peptidase
MMFRCARGAALAVALMLCGQAGVVRADESLPLEAYSAMPAIEFMELSPEGELMARITVVGEERALVVTRLATGEHLAAAVVGEAKVRDLRWIGEDRVLIVTSQTRAIPTLGVPKSELYFGLVLDLDTRKFAQVLSRTDGVLSVLYGPASIRTTDDGHAIFVRGVSVEGNSRIDLYRVDPSSGRGRSVVDLTWDVSDYVLDADGQVIATAEYDDRRRRWALKLAVSRNRFSETWTIDAPVDTPALLGMGRTPRTIIVSAHRPDLAVEGSGAETGYLLFEVNVDTGEWTRLPFEHHPDSLVHHPRTRLLVGGARNADDGVRYEFLDAATGARWAAIERAFAGKAPQLISWTDDLKKVVVFTDVGESGLYQIVDFDRGVADILADAYPNIPAAQVGATRSIRYKAADGLEIRGYLTLPPGVEEAAGLPLVVLAHGGPASQDVIGFDWWTQALASRGYAVLQANFRGSTGYGLAFMEAGYGEWGRKMQTDLSDGVRWLADQGWVDPERVCIVGASYGGYAAMAGPTIDRGVYRCAVSVGGVSDLRRMVHWEASQGARRDNQAVRYWNRFMGAEKLNDRALDALSPARLADDADGPMLLIHGRDDTVVPIEQSRVMADALRRAGKPVELIELNGEDHWLSRAETRQRMLAETVRFLEAHNPPD